MNLNPGLNDELKQESVVQGVISPQSVVDEKSSWKYLDNGSDQGSAWRSAGFNDSGWKTGAGQFGFGDGDEATVLQSGFVTYYFRKHVNITDVNALPDSVILSMIHDDGAVVYINGTEVLRTPLMPQTGTITYTTGTSTFIPTAQENNFFTYKIAKSHFNNGDNVIAVEVHNQNSSSSDVSFDLSIRNAVESDPDGPYVFFRNNQYIVKSITKQNGYVSQTYASRDQVNLNVELPGGGSFAVNLKPQLLNREPSESATLPTKYFATSDIEGSIDAFILLLKKANIIDNNYKWTYGTGHLFIMGDVFDRGKYVTQCLWLIYKLEQEAANAGGKVHFILGNHDIMNLIGDYRYVNAKYTANAQTIGEPYSALYDADSELGKWLRSKNILEKSGNTLFLHAGISPDVAALPKTVTDLNVYVGNVINKTCTTQNCKTATSSSVGLYWYRGMAQQTLTQAEVDAILAKFGADRTYIGHTILNNQITLLYQSKILAIDLEHANNYNNGYMEGVYYNSGCYFKFHTTQLNSTYTPLIGSNCSTP
ncbi:metallophosphoesterase [Pedobacter sp. 22226]|uniref:metallophosphoesterase n=1 Tax=Pedobacter sp. 22226 TaxID=3453894 RepID=UPI003F82B8FA